MTTESLRAYVEYGVRDRGDGVLELKCRPDVEARVYTMGPANGAWERLPRIDAPTVVACGETSTDIGPPLARQIAERLPHGERRGVAGLRPLRAATGSRPLRGLDAPLREFVGSLMPTALGHRRVERHRARDRAHPREGSRRHPRRTQHRQARRTRAEIGGARVVAVDLSDPAGPRKLVAELPAVDVLVNNAGFADWSPFADASEAKLDEMIELNVGALTRLARAPISRACSNAATDAS
jgi:hypothetical protein